jgi:hypothetical protein
MSAPPLGEEVDRNFVQALFYVRLDSHAVRFDELARLTVLDETSDQFT